MGFIGLGFWGSAEVPMELAPLSKEHSYYGFRDLILILVLVVYVEPLGTKIASPNPIAI